ncbi:UDP-glycosyltransferase 85A2 [Triticum urartu]|uniref:Glycosyltransferase n=1 Tax=Triticum urartu TaxID=4572 RepID=M7ZZ80_TRIUA|nr:UDP-glycosyltransferase 85A2 [Triticum urartu]
MSTLQAAAGVEKRHAVFFPFPAQGHVKPALQLAKLLHRCHGFQVTFVHTEHNRRRLLRSRGPGALAGVPGFRFAAVPDGLSESDADAAQDMSALLSTTEALAPHFRSLISGLPPVSCVVSDIEHILYADKDMGLQCVTFWITSACSFMMYQQCQRLVDMGIVPLRETEAGQLRNGCMDSTVLDWVPGMPKGICLKDFPDFVLTADPDDAMLKVALRSMACHRTTPSAVIFHTFDEIDREAIATMSTFLPKIYAVGPLPLLLGQASGTGGFLEETKARRYVTRWCPQEAVLQHEATGAFLTHCGWNSVLESVCAGVPMLCRPFGADQYTNARYACSEWRVGLEIGGDVKRDEVEAAIREVMGEGEKGKEIKRMLNEWKEKAIVAAQPSGSSWVNLEKVVNEVLTVPPAKGDTEI